MAYQRVEVLTGLERRRAYTPAEKALLVAEAFRPGVVVKEAARRLGVHESLLYRWRRALRSPTDLVGTPAFLPVTVAADGGLEPEIASRPAGPPLVASSDPPASVSPAVLEVMLPGGAQVRMQGAVDPALVVSVLKTLSAPGRSS